MLGIFPLIHAYIRPLIKWFLRRCTRLCELQRICYGHEKGASRKKAIELSLDLSRTPRIKAIIGTLNDGVVQRLAPTEFHGVVVPQAVATISATKRIRAKCHPDFGKLLAPCIESIWGYRRLCAEVDDVRQVAYDHANDEHEAKLLRLWSLLMPTQPLQRRKTTQWQDIGFQGDDPMTDFRGMGMLGLENLLYFADEYNAAARHVLSHSMHPTFGYTFAIVGINLTSMAYTLLSNGAAKTHFYNLSTQSPSLKHFHRLYAYLFYEFDKFWLECEPTSLMDFSSIHARFLANILARLTDNQTVFKIYFAVDCV